MQTISEIKEKNNKKVSRKKRIKKHIQKAKIFLIQEFLEDCLNKDEENSYNPLTDGIEHIITKGVKKGKSDITLVKKNKEISHHLNYVFHNITEDFVDKYWSNDDYMDPFYYLSDKNQFIEAVRPSGIFTNEDIIYIENFDPNYDDGNLYLESTKIFKQCYKLIKKLSLPYILRVLKRADYNVYHPTKFFGLCKSNKLVLSLKGIKDIQNRKC